MLCASATEAKNLCGTSYVSCASRPVPSTRRHHRERPSARQSKRRRSWRAMFRTRARRTRRGARAVAPRARARPRATYARPVLLLNPAARRARPARRGSSALVNRCRAPTAPIEKIRVWVDYISIPQKNRSEQKLAIASLPTFASCADYFVVIAPDATHHNTGCAWPGRACRGRRFRLATSRRRAARRHHELA